MKAPATSPDGLRCGGCGITTPMTVDRARAAKWRIPWTPNEKPICPKCWDAKRVREPRWTPEAYDEPLWEEES